MRTPKVSPTHHVPQWMEYIAQGIRPPIASAVTPTVALIMQLTGPPSRSKAPIFLAAVSVFGKPTQRCTREAPTKACTTAPTPIVVGIAADVRSVAAFVAP